MSLQRYFGITSFCFGAANSFVDVGSDDLLVYRYLSTSLYRDVAWLTLFWILLAGLIQLFVVIRYFFKRDPCLDPLTTSVKVLFFASTLILMAPVVLNLFGAYLLFRNEGNVDEDVNKYDRFEIQLNENENVNNYLEKKSHRTKTYGKISVSSFRMRSLSIRSFVCKW